MKGFIYTLSFLLSVVLITTHASAQPHYSAPYKQVRVESFFYYPQSNVYYSFRTHQYIYPLHNGWQIAYRLPHYIRIGREDRITIEHRGFDVWTDNVKHRYTYSRRNNVPPAIVYMPDRRTEHYNGY